MSFEAVDFHTLTLTEMLCLFISNFVGTSIVDQSPSIGGRSHDFKVFKEDHAARSIASEFRDYPRDAVWRAAALKG